MRSHWKPIVALLLLTPFLTELLSGNLPAAKFFQPQVFLMLATVAYGFPVLLLREFAVRHRLGILGLLALGFVYGIFNEGIIAKTFYLATNVPINNFDGYGCVYGIAIPWAVTISTWHALHALLYPIVAIYYFFPDHRDSPWLNWQGTVGLAVPTVVIGALTFFSHGPGRPAGLLAHGILMVALSGLLLWLACKLPSSPGLGGPGKVQWAALLWGGLGFLALFLLPVIMAGVKAPVLAFYGYYVLLFALIIFRLSSRAVLPTTTVLLFALGDDFVLAFFGIAGAVGPAVPGKLFTNAAFVAVFAWLFARLRKSNR